MCTYPKNMEGYKLKDLKLKEFDSIQEMFDKAFKRVNTFEDFRTELVEGKEKRARTKLIQENSKKQKVEDDKETTKLKYIVDWKIYKEGRKSYYQIMRADGKSQMYMFFSQMLKNFDRVHSLRMQHMQIYMLVEKKYPLAPLTLSMMLKKKLNIDYEMGSTKLLLQAWYLDAGTVIGDSEEVAKVLNIIKRPLSSVKLLGGAVSRDTDFINGLAMRRAANTFDLMSLLP
ncbi:hypothetical protein Tco_1500199 [Tanacetum coccineum]